jgi:hypothetical protein
LNNIKVRFCFLKIYTNIINLQIINYHSNLNPDWKRREGLYTTTVYRTGGVGSDGDKNEKCKTSSIPMKLGHITIGNSQILHAKK